MAFVNCGAFVTGRRPATKKALREAMKANPNLVSFDTTSMFDGNNTYYGDKIPAGITLQVTGPDPHNKRSWYATVTPDGKVK